MFRADDEAFRRIRKQTKGRGSALLILLTLPFLAGGGCETESLKEAKKLSYPRDMEFKVIFINEDPAWKVALWQGGGDPPAGSELKPNERREETLTLHFDRPFEIRTLDFSASAHGRVQAQETLQVRPADSPVRGVVFTRTPEGSPDIFWLTNP